MSEQKETTMREIKFRAWLKDCENKKPYALYFDLESISQGSIMARDGEWHYLVNLKDTTEQFTGLRDKNGREIYEGDILAYNLQDYNGIDHFYKGAIESGGAEFGINGENNEYCYWHSLNMIIENDDEPEIIGNIHENPELLE